MSVKSKLLAAAATVTLVGGVGLAGALTAGPASAGTPSCGQGCVNTFNQDFGPGYVVDVLRQGQKVGQPIILFRTANFDPAEDWSLSAQGKVHDFYKAGLVNADVDLHYGGGATGFPDLEAFEIEYAPYGVDSGLCLGVSVTAYQNEGVSLQACGVSSRTVWIFDSLDVAGGPVPLINGSDTNFSHPFVLTYPETGFPTDKPRPQLTTTNLTGFAAPGNNGVIPVISSVSSSQLWVSLLGTTEAGNTFSPGTTAAG